MAAAAVSAFIAYYWDVTAPSAQPAIKAEDPEVASTFIPAGYVLVPIEVANFESLDSILGKFGVVDLYLPSEDPKARPRKVAERVRILRAPLNPSRFAVLARENDSPRLVSHGGPFTVVVQNPDTAGTGIVRDDSSRTNDVDRKIEIGSGEDPSRKRGRRSRIIYEAGK
jgi:hypothetical protein